MHLVWYTLKDWVFYIAKLFLFLLCLFLLCLLFIPSSIPPSLSNSSNIAGVEKDEAKAIAYFERASHHGLAEANNNLGCLYKSGGHFIKKDPQQARIYFKAGSMNGILIYHKPR